MDLILMKLSSNNVLCWKDLWCVILERLLNNPDIGSSIVDHIVRVRLDGLSLTTHSSCATRELYNMKASIRCNWISKD